MKNRIKILSEDLANKIAAGEVIERPASVVKELVENSIDAKAKKIIVEIENGGRNLIRIIDDGIGMSEDDAITAFERHSTSKIATIEDLTNIHTLGFRGEALPSIASVSQLEMITRSADSLNGTLIKFYGGVLKDVIAHASPVGTSVSVKKLFFNTPARLKFLKSVSTEITHIINIITQQSIANPTVSFRLIHNGRKILDFPPASDLKARLREIFGKEICENLIEINLTKEKVKIHGFIGKPSIARKDRRHQYIFVNQRHIRNRTITRGIYEGFIGLPKDREPIFVIFLKVDSAFVDVNVHPTKAEVRFSNGQLIYKSIIEAVSTSFSFDEKVGDFYSEEKNIYTQKIYHLNSSQITSSAPKKLSTQKQFRNLTPKSYRKEISAYESLLKEYKSEPSKAQLSEGENYIIIGQIHNCYIILQTKDGMMIVDQHVAHERVLYEQAKKAVIENPISSQRLLFPLTLELSPVEFSLLSKNRELLAKLGFDIRVFSGRTIVIETIPSTIKNWDDGKILRDILDMESEDVTGIVDDEMEKIITNFSCKSAIKKGMKMSQQEINQLISDWLATDNPYTCPHGRPIVLNLTLAELDRKFGRSG